MWKLRLPFVEELKTSSIGSTVSGLVGFFGFCCEKKPVLVGSINFFNPPQTKWKPVKSIRVIMSRDSSSRND